MSGDDENEANIFSETNRALTQTEFSVKQIIDDPITKQALEFQRFQRLLIKTDLSRKEIRKWRSKSLFFINSSRFYNEDFELAPDYLFYVYFRVYHSISFQRRLMQVNL